MKYLILIFIILMSCSEDKSAFDSSNGGHTRSNDYESISDVFSNYFISSELRFENEVDSSGFIIPPFMLNENDVIYFSKANKAHIIIGDRVMSSIDFGNNYAVANPTFDNNENIYIPLNNGSIASYNVKDRKNPILNWKSPQIDTALCLMSDLMVYEIKIYSSSSIGGINIYDTTSKLISNIKKDNDLIKQFSINDNGYLFFATTKNDFDFEDTLYCYKDGKEVFAKSLLGRLYMAPVSKKGKTYITALFRLQGELLSRLYCIDESGNEVYRIESNITIKHISVDSKENIYVISSNAGLGMAVSYINKYDSKGKKLWTLTVDLNIPSPLVIAEDVLAFSGSRDVASGVFYVDKDNGKLLSTMSLESAPLYNLIPTFKPSGGLIFGASNKSTIINVERSKLDKLLR